jgi:two-component system, NtrC family, response regulator GlrR
MKTQRILVCDAKPPNECVDSLMAAIEDGKNHLCSKSGADMEMCVMRGVGDARAAITTFKPDVILLLLEGSVFARTGTIVDIAESTSARPPVVGLIAEGGQEEARAVLRAGADDFILPPLRTSEILTRVRCVLDRKTRRWPATRDAGSSNASGIIGKSPAFRREIERLPRIAGCDASVLISGETGTGKELFARAIHDLSPRASRPFVPLNCGAIPAELAESELFGHERGAFTGAHARSRGMIREADGGTLFLDEVTSLPASLQVKLLRFLQEKEVRPLGNGSLHRVNVRVIAAADRGIDGEVRDGRFRRDLYYRLNTIPICLPSLRERRADIPLLARYFLRRFGGEATFSENAFEKLQRYDWPGNVRELEHVVERSIVLSSSIKMRGLDVTLPQTAEETPPKGFRAAKLRIISQFERSYVEDLLVVYHGNISRAARAAGKNRRAFWELIRKHGITVEKYREETGEK